MSIVDYDVRPCAGVFDYPKGIELSLWGMFSVTCSRTGDGWGTYSIDILPVDRRVDIPVSQHSEA